MLIIFDLDGTILNTLEDLATSGNHILARHGYPTHPTEAYKMFVGNGIRKLIERILPEECRNDVTISTLYQEFLEYYDLHKMDKTMPYSGISELLEGLQNQGIKLAVASNKAHEAMGPLMRHYFPTIRFSAVLGYRQGVLPKPHPDMVFEIIEAARETQKSTLFVGDSCVDMETASRANLKKVGVLWGYRTKEELVNAGADYILEKPELTSFNKILQFM